MDEVDANSAVAGEIMTPFVIMLESNATFQDVVNTLREKNISAVFIHENSKDEYYIISQTDVINYLQGGGMFCEDLSSVSVTEFMNGPVDRLDIETSIENVIRFMAKHRYKRALISKEGKPAGVISTRDIMKWNNTYFKPAKPQILFYMDNLTSNLIGKHIFTENINDDVQEYLIDIYGGALSSISAITDEIINKSGSLYHLSKDKRSILFEPYNNITGILICDYNSIDLRRKLQKATKEFYDKNLQLFKAAEEKDFGISNVMKLDTLVPIFKKKH